MSFHTGQSFTFGETPSATKWNYLWENDYALADGSGIEDDAILARHLHDQIVGASNLNLGPGTQLIATSQTTTSTSYTDLATSGPAATVTVGANGILLVGVYARAVNNTSNAFAKMGFALSGANTQAAADNYAFAAQAYAGGAVNRTGSSWLVTGLTPGSTVVTAKYAVETGGGGSGTGTFADRRLFAIPL